MLFLSGRIAGVRSTEQSVSASLNNNIKFRKGRYLIMEYYSFNKYMRDRFGTKVYKIALDAGLTCPNRDGTIDTRGCIFCSEGGFGRVCAENNTGKC